jgi:hypothetical protein
MTLDALTANGLTITLDQAPAPNCPLSEANVIVTVELANPAAVDNLNLPQDPNPRAPRAPLTNLRTVTVIDSPVSLNGTDITWQLPSGWSATQGMLRENLNTYLYQGAPAQQWAKLRVRLIGQMIWAAGTGGPVYLDGLALGQPGTRQDGVTPRLDLRLPSGTGVVASDFEGWLNLLPTLQPTDLGVTYPAVTVTVGRSGEVTGVVVTGSSPPQAVIPTAVVAVNYPPVTDATVMLSLSGASGVGNIVSIPGTATIPSGQFSASVPINVIGNPGINPAGAPITLNFNISATVATQSGDTFSVFGAFSVTGAAPPPFITGGVPHPVVSQ